MKLLPSRSERRASLDAREKRRRMRIRKRMFRTVIIGGSIMLAGLIILLVGVKMAGGSFKGLIPMQEFTDKRYEALSPAGEYSKVIIDDVRSSIRVERARDDKISVKYYESDSEGCVVTDGEGTLRVRHANHSSAVIDIEIGFTRPDTEIVLYLPSSFTGEISIESDRGRIEVEDIRGIRGAVLHALEGDIAVNGLYFSEELTVRADGGGAEVKRASGGTIKASAARELRASTLRATRDVQLTCLRGDISLEDLECLSFELETGRAGRINAAKVSASSGKAASSSGDIEISLVGGWTVKAETSGKTDLPAPSGKKTLSVNSVSGDIKVYEAK